MDPNILLAALLPVPMLAQIKIILLERQTGTTLLLNQLEKQL